jgi:hypothetical protein
MVGACRVPAPTSHVPSPGHRLRSLRYDPAKMRNRLLCKLIVLTALVSGALAPAAQAYNDGRGFYGATTDKVTTDAGFILVVFFPLFVFTMSMIQRALDKRKEARKAAHKAFLANGQWRGGW